MLTLLAAATALASAPSPLGLWDTPVDHSRVRLSACGARICGYVISSAQLSAHPGQKDVHNGDPALRERPIHDLEIMEAQAADDGAWKGWVYDPSSGHTYEVRVRMAPGDHLEITGCLVRPLCRTQAWTRVRTG
jgi:uncharacterized protein (DUF2147 family)